MEIDNHNKCKYELCLNNGLFDILFFKNIIYICLKIMIIYYKCRIFHLNNQIISFLKLYWNYLTKDNLDINKLKRIIYLNILYLLNKYLDLYKEYLELNEKNGNFKLFISDLEWNELYLESLIKKDSIIKEKMSISYPIIGENISNNTNNEKITYIKGNNEELTVEKMKRKNYLLNENEEKLHWKKKLIKRYLDEILNE
jgi:hypothetical protein